MVLTANKIRTVMKATSHLADVIKTMGEVPNEVLYTSIQEQGLMTLAPYESAINVLIRAKLVRRDPGHLLVWIGPK